ncbi:uncharacterized protein LOC103499958 isoform X1 [Cucumis melo]|uniref:Uncharacterized protein LOC103499958 isoform X1 n=1 Tax=Cucumis melo TaxID=3656 RepID=A0ABM3L1Q2_CUCME|nr:uncharacterized protein LOC103499958 isoform X1 [Cucumis melo]
MTQKANLFKGKQKRKTIPPNRHGKIPQTRKGKRFVKPSKTTKEMETDRVAIRVNYLKHPSFPLAKSGFCEVSKFINYCNETKAATLANKEGGQLSIVKTPANADNSNAKKE